MPRTLSRLTALQVAKLAKQRSTSTQLHHDGGGLYLIVDRRSQSVSWAYRYMIAGRARMLGLGRYPDISLHDARARAAEARGQKAHGFDPLEAKDAAREAERQARARRVTFKVLADEFIQAKEAGWSNLKHGAQWRSTLQTYAFPIIGDLVVEEIDANHVLRVLQQSVRSETTRSSLWEARPETASRLRGRIEAVLDYAKVKGLRHGDNPAAWRGNLSLALPAKATVKQVKSHQALPIDEMATFMAAVRANSAPSARAVEFAILTAARTSEVLGARWSELDSETGVWRVPAARMKSKKEHRVPLSSAALKLLERTRVGSDGRDHVFVNATGQKFSNMVLLMLLKRMGHSDLTMHGFRSTFRDWVAERTTFPRELAEKALAHSLGSEVEAAYQRSDLLERRRDVMEAWAVWCAGRGALGSSRHFQTAPSTPRSMPSAPASA